MKTKFTLGDRVMIKETRETGTICGVNQWHCSFLSADDELTFSDATSYTVAINYPDGMLTRTSEDNLQLCNRKANQQSPSHSSSSSSSSSSSPANKPHNAVQGEAIDC